MNREKVKNKERKKPRKRILKRPVVGAGRFIRDLLGGEYLKTGTFRYLPYLIFIAALASVYIANNYYAENKVRQINKLRKELKELRYEYITSKSKLMNMSKQSQIARKLSDKGVKESTEPIKIIKVNTNEK